MKTTTIAAVLALALLATPAVAHDPHPRHGGRIVQAGNYHVELVAKGSIVEAFLLGHDDKPIASEGHKGLAILAVDGKSERVPLAAAGSNQLKGTATVALPEKPKGVVQITSPKGATVSAKFN